MEAATINPSEFVFTKREAATVLRLDEGKTDANAEKAVDRMVDRGILKCAILGGKRCFTRESIVDCLRGLSE